jgi:hypothetical protein
MRLWWKRPARGDRQPPGHEASATGGEERDELGFREAVTNAFVFLEALGFARVDAAPTVVRYAGDDRAVSIYHERPSFEIGFAVDIDGDHYPLGEMIRLADPARGRAYRDFSTRTPDGVRGGVERLRDLALRYAGPMLRGDAGTLKALRDQRPVLVRELARWSLMASVKPEADDAFRLGRYREAAELYDRIRAGLTPAETRKADLAKQRATLGSKPTRR